MISSITSMVTLLSVLTTAIPTMPRSIGYKTTCDAAMNPSWSDCQGASKMIQAVLDKNNGNYPITTEPQGNCAVTYYNDCKIGICDFKNQGYVAGNLIVDGINDLQSDCEPNMAGGSATDDDGSMLVNMYSNDNNPSKRAAEDSKPQWTNAYTIENVAPAAYRQQVLNSQPGGSSWTLSNSNSQTNMVEASVSLSESLFGAFTAMESVMYGYTQMVSESSSQTITNNCPSGETGTLYWFPLFTQYHGGYNNGGPSPADIYIPQVEKNGDAAGKYSVVCSND